VAAWQLYLVRRRPADALRGPAPAWYDFVFSGWGVDALYQAVIVKPGLAVCRYLAEVADQKGIDGAVNGLAMLFRQAAGVLRRLQVGYVRVQLLYVAVGALIVIALLLRG